MGKYLMKKLKEKNTIPFIHDGVIKKKLNGYVFIKVGAQFIAEHRLVAESILKRQLDSKESLHHINHHREDNRPENLMLFESQALHKSFENKQRQFGITNPIKKEISERRLR